MGSRPVSAMRPAKNRHYRGRIITVTTAVLSKLSLLGKDLDAYSLETVEMFYKDAATAGYPHPTTTASRRSSPRAYFKA